MPTKYGASVAEQIDRAISSGARGASFDAFLGLFPAQSVGAAERYFSRS